jgi:hypothetical protein
VEHVDRDREVRRLLRVREIADEFCA